MITNTGSKRCYLTKNCPRVQGQGSWLKPGTWPHWAEFHHFCTSIWQGGFGFLSWQDGSGFQKAISWKHYLQSSLKPSISKLKSFQTTSYCGTIQKHVWQAKMNPSISQIRKTSPIGKRSTIFLSWGLHHVKKWRHTTQQTEYIWQYREVKWEWGKLFDVEKIRGPMDPTKTMQGKT